MKQFGRQVKLVLGNEHESLIIEGLRISFDITKTINSTPNQAAIKIYNLTESHRNQITSKTFNKVSLDVGYKNLSNIFIGDIITSQVKREGLDFITELDCGDGYHDYTTSRVSTTLRAGATDAEILAEAARDMRKTEQGVVSLPNDRALPRGKVLTGNSRDVIDKVARNNSADWSIQNGQLVVLPKSEVLSDSEGFVISQDTGMIGSPERSNGGLKVTCLLNPQLMIGGLVRVESVIRLFNGDYKVVELTHSGDLLSDNWYTTILCDGGKFSRALNGK